MELSYIEQISDKIVLANSLIEKLENDFPNVEGSLKTRRNISKEIKFLEKVSFNDMSNDDDKKDEITFL